MAYSWNIEYVFACDKDYSNTRGTKALLYLIAGKPLVPFWCAIENTTKRGVAQFG